MDQLKPTESQKSVYSVYLSDYKTGRILSQKVGNQVE